MKNRSVFPYRRSGGNGRPKQGNPNRRNRDQRRGGGSAQDMLSQLQPVTKALAQMLAGNTRASGQIKHARSILENAQRLVDERQVERLRPVQKEEYFELLARLRLTLADAEDRTIDEPQQEAPAAPAKPPLDRDKLRALALSIVASSHQEPEPTGPEIIDPEEMAAMAKPSPGIPEPAASSTVQTIDDEPEAQEEITDKSDRRQKLRLKSIKSHDTAESAKI